MIQSHCQSDLFHFTYRFFGSLFEYGSTLSIFWSVNPLVLNVSSTYSKYFSGFSLFTFADSIIEPCRKMTVLYDKSTNKLSCQSQYTKCKWYYFYFNDSEFGWMFFKFQTWFYFNVTIYINGRKYLSKLFDKKIFNIQCTTILFLQFLILTKPKILQISFLTNIFQILLMDKLPKLIFILMIFNVSWDTPITGV